MSSGARIVQWALCMNVPRGLINHERNVKNDMKFFSYWNRWGSGVRFKDSLRVEKFKRFVLYIFLSKSCLVFFKPLYYRNISHLNASLNIGSRTTCNIIIYFWYVFCMIDKVTWHARATTEAFCKNQPRLKEFSSNLTGWESISFPKPTILLSCETGNVVSRSRSAGLGIVGWEYETRTLHMPKKSCQGRGRDSWLWPNWTRPLGTRMTKYLKSHCESHCVYNTSTDNR